MKVAAITIKASRKFNHPSEPYANFGFEFAVTIDPGPAGVPEGFGLGIAAELEAAAEDHKQQILSDCALEEARTRYEGELRIMREELAKLPSRIAQLEERRASGEAWQKECEAGANPEWPDWMHRYQNNPHEQIAAVVERLADFQKCYAGLPAKIAAVEKKLADLPEPALLKAVAKKIHPGHWDHPDTDPDGDLGF